MPTSVAQHMEDQLLNAFISLLDRPEENPPLEGLLKKIEVIPYGSDEDANRLLERLKSIAPGAYLWFLDCEFFDFANKPRNAVLAQNIRFNARFVAVFATRRGEDKRKELAYRFLDLMTSATDFKIADKVNATTGAIEYSFRPTRLTSSRNFENEEFAAIGFNFQIEAIASC